MNSVQGCARPALGGVRWGALLRVLVPLVVLNALLTFGNDWPGVGVRFELLLSVELCLLATLVLVWVGRRGQPSARALAVLAVVFVVLVIVRYIEVTVPAVYGRPLNLYWDGRHSWQVLRMATVEHPPWRIGAIALMLAGGGAALFVLVRALLATLAQGFGRCGGQRWMLAAGAGAVLLHLTQPALVGDVRAAFAAPVSAGIVRSGAQLHDALSPRSVARLTPSPTFAGNVAALNGSDVVLIFAEAYGAVTLDDAGIAAALADSRAAVHQAAQASGRGVVSARVRSPTFGGGSWLAHAALLSGVDTRDPGDYDLLLTTARPTLVSHFARNGYHTVAWMPGLQSPWPEGRFYGFDRYVDVDGTGYRGPAFGFWRIPDQAALALLQAQELTPVASAASAAGEIVGARAPRFVVFPTLSSHAPFRPVAPYLRDWNRLLGDEPYTAAELDAALAQPVSWADPRPAYVDAMRYTFDWLAGYLRERAARDQVLIVVGDHQPVAGVSGRDASWEVPVHVFSADPALLARFEGAGFSAGLAGDLPMLGDMNALTAMLVEIFAAPENPR